MTFFRVLASRAAPWLDLGWVRAAEDNPPFAAMMDDAIVLLEWRGENDPPMPEKS